MNLKSFTGPGSTPSRRRFWDKAVSAVIASQKLAGRFVTIDEHPGKGTVINVADTSARRGGGGTGACCYDDGTCDDFNASECATSGGHFQGVGTTCDGTDCSHGGGGTSGACCVESSCEIRSPADCFADSGTYQGDNIDCYPNPCDFGACCLEGVCTFGTPEDCSGMGGIYHPGVTCDSNPFLCCTNCFPLFSPFDDGGGNCFTTQNCDGTLSGPVPCDSMWFTLTQHCVGEDVDCLELCNISGPTDPTTCDFTNSCDCCDCCDSCVNGTVNSVSDQAFPCP